MKTLTTPYTIVSVTIESKNQNIILMTDNGQLITEYFEISDSDEWIDIENIGDVNIYDLGQHGKKCTIYPERGNYQKFYNARLILK